VARIPDAFSALAAIALLVWLLAVAGAFSSPAAVDWLVFGIGAGLLLAARVTRAAAQRPL
jgi:hypothetical protein